MPLIGIWDIALLVDVLGRLKQARQAGLACAPMTETMISATTARMASVSLLGAGCQTWGV